MQYYLTRADAIRLGSIKIHLISFLAIIEEGFEGAGRDQYFPNCGFKSTIRRILMKARFI